MDYIDQHKQQFGVEPICEVLTSEGIAVAPSGYHAHTQRPPSRRTRHDAALAEVIEATFWDRDKGRGVYGARKMCAQLRRDGVTGMAGAPVARCTVERLMRSLGSAGSAAADRRSPRSLVGSPSGPRIWSTVTSPPSARTGCGWST